MTMPEDAVACVFGAGSGIGRAIAERLATAGARVDCRDLDATRVEQTAKGIESAGGTAWHGQVDVRDSAAVDAALADSARRHGPVGTVVCTPGVNVRKPMLSYTDADYRTVLETNLTGSFNVLRGAARVMVEQGSGGGILLISSISCRIVEPGQVVYAATKAAIVQLVRVAAAELGQHGIRVNAIAPGPVETALTQPILADAGWRDAYGEKTAIGRWARPEEIAEPAAFLVSPAASYITGEVLFVHGGSVDLDPRFQHSTDTGTSST